MHRKARRGRRRAPKRSPVAAIAGGLGELLLTAGVLVLLFVGYQLWGTGIQTAAAQSDLRSQFALQIDNEEPEEVYDGLELGAAYGILRIERFGENWEWLVVEGVEDDDLKNGPGRYPDNVHAGEIGNFAIAAHRSGHGEPFAKFPELHEGDIIEIETHTGVYRYELDTAPNGNADGNRINITDSWVVDPVPGEPRSTEPTEARLTLTTCWPRWGSSHRMYASGLLVDVEER
ncbi:class E sortase [Phytoactinopolyspora limicola]|uniref:class E sortase n=1 Tax=Phytoactinopolyspora limicola TaxID=2715536 RepID=UPI00140C6221|nr:class E sortase [Phytoactinopolyspora limicola]